MGYFKLRVMVTVLLLFVVAPRIAHSQTAAPTKSPAELNQLRQNLINKARAEDRFLHPYQMPSNNSSDTLRPLFPKLSAFQPKGTRSALFDDSGIVNGAYESNRRLFFLIDRSPSQGNSFWQMSIFDGGLTSIPLSQKPFAAMSFSQITPEYALFYGLDRTTKQTEFWMIRNGAITPAAGPGTTVFLPQLQNPASCNVTKSGVTFFDRSKPLTINSRTLELATRGISSQQGIIIGCRRIGQTKFLWLTGDESRDDGVTFEVVGTTLRPLFQGHPFIQTGHFLVFMENNDDIDSKPRRYLIIEDTGTSPG